MQGISLRYLNEKRNTRASNLQNFIVDHQKRMMNKHYPS